MQNALHLLSYQKSRILSTLGSGKRLREKALHVRSALRREIFDILRPVLILLIPDPDRAVVPFHCFEMIEIAAHFHKPLRICLVSADIYKIYVRNQHLPFKHRLLGASSMVYKDCQPQSGAD